jgi:hypothetical protein
MKHLLTLSLLLPFAFVAPTQAQQVNVYAERYCYTNIEQYVPGYYTNYGNYVGGYVNRTRNRVPCGENVSVNQQPYYNNNGGGYYRRRTCNPNNAAYGAILGGGLAEALSGGNGWKSSSNWTRNYSGGSSSGSYNYSNRNYKSNGWSLFGAGLGALMYSC